MLPEDPDDAKTKYRSTRMVAPGKEHTYFFSIEGKAFVAKDQAQRRQRPAVRELKSFGRTTTETTGEDEEIDADSLPALNLFSCVKQKVDPYDAQAIVAMKCKPRITKKLGARGEQKTPWLHSTSCFKGYRSETTALLDACFEQDWQSIESKVEYLIKKEAEREQVKKFMKKNYKMLRDAYKLTAGQDAQGNQMSIGKNSFGALMQACGDLVDNKTLKLSDLDIGYIAVKAADMKKANKLVPADQLIRYNFLEIQIRLADQKHIKNGSCKTFLEALQLWIAQLSPSFTSTDSHIWRKQELWQEDNDLALKRQYKTIQKLYEKYSGRFSMPGAPRFVSPLEFAQLVEDSGVISDAFTFKEIYPIWNLSMMT